MSRETRWNPSTGILSLGFRAEEMLAEPVPVRRPGAREMGSAFASSVMGEEAGTGTTNVGLKLRTVSIGVKNMLYVEPECKPEKFDP